MKPLIAFLILLVSAHAQTRVVDGDTIHVDGERIRIHALDCPELGDPGGVQAKRVLEGIVGVHKITIERNGRDRYGRTVAKLFADGHDVACLMIRLGVCGRYERYDRRGEYIKCERK